jgi:hypothetical protein
MSNFARIVAAGVGLFGAAIISPAPAMAQSSGGAGQYVADTSGAPPELRPSSSIELRPGGQFIWRLQMGQLQLSARGDWTRDGDMLRLDNSEQVGEPELELAQSSRDAGTLLRVSLDPATTRMASVLELEVEYPGDSFAIVPISSGEVSIPLERTPLGVRLTSASFNFRTQSVPVALNGDNNLTLRLVPADLGQAFFGSQQVRFDERGMTLVWRGIALRYKLAALLEPGSAIVRAPGQKRTRLLCGAISPQHRQVNSARASTRSEETHFAPAQAFRG